MIWLWFLLLFLVWAAIWTGHYFAEPPLQPQDELKGAMKADDERLRAAEERVWPGKTWGCDAPEMFADEIEALRLVRDELEEALAREVERRRAAERKVSRLQCLIAKPATDAHVKAAEEWMARLRSEPGGYAKTWANLDKADILAALISGVRECDELKARLAALEKGRAGE